MSLSVAAEKPREKVKSYYGGFSRQSVINYKFLNRVLRTKVIHGIWRNNNYYNKTTNKIKSFKIYDCVSKGSLIIHFVDHSRGYDHSITNTKKQSTTTTERRTVQEAKYKRCFSENVRMYFLSNWNNWPNDVQQSFHWCIFCVKKTLKGEEKRNDVHFFTIACNFK